MVELELLDELDEDELVVLVLDDELLELDELLLDDVVVELLLDEELDDEDPPQSPAVAAPLTVSESIFAIGVELVA